MAPTGRVGQRESGSPDAGHGYAVGGFVHRTAERAGRALVLRFLGSVASGRGARDGELDLGVVVRSRAGWIVARPRT